MNHLFFSVLVLVGTTLLSAGLVPLASALARRLGVLDQPGHRKVHDNPTPRLGGLAVFASFSAVVASGHWLVPVLSGVPSAQPWIGDALSALHQAHLVEGKLIGIVIGATLAFCVGFADDLLGAGFPVVVKASGQLAAALVLVYADVRVTFLPWEWMNILVTVLWIVGMTNTFNLLDNMDGLSAGVAVIASLVLIINAWAQGQFFVSLILIAFVGSLLGFLFFNFNPASVFLGDCGSLFIGFVMASLTLLERYVTTASSTLFPVLMPVVVLAVPVIDTLTVIVIRLREGRPIYVGDNRHLSHRLVSLGFSKRATVLFIYLATLSLGLGATSLRTASLGQSVLILVQTAGFIALLLILMFVDRQEGGTTPVIASGVGVLLLALAAGTADPVFDVNAILEAPLEARVQKTSEVAGIVTEEVSFHSETDGATRVEIFGFFSYPKGARKLPAYVWNQGGAAPADAGVTQEGARRGYATLCIDLPMPGYRSTGGYPIVQGLELGADPRHAPIAHGAVALLRAVSFLASRPEVDPTRIGMAGSSWGGFFATLQAGLDPRLAAVASWFGSGRLDLGNPWWDERAPAATPPDAAARERWRTSLDPALRLPHSRVPIAWFAGTNDQFYWMPALSQTFLDAAGPKHLALLPNWNHALDAAMDREAFAWLDAHLKGGAPLPEVGPLSVTHQDGGSELRFGGTSSRPLVSAEVLVSAGEGGHWASRCWTTVPATLAAGSARVVLPPSVLPLWVSGTLIDDAGFRASTPIAQIPRAARGGNGPVCDGAAAWGGFETAAEDYLRRHGLKVPEWSTDAAEGKRAARLSGKASYPLFYTAGLPHRFACRVKADEATELAVRVAGRFDNVPVDADGRFPVGTQWSDVVLELTPPQGSRGGLSVRFEIPAGRSVLVDAVSFRPVPNP